MHIATGNDRIVLVVPSLAIVLKVPNVWTSSSHIRYYVEMLGLSWRQAWTHPRSFWCHVWYVIEAIGDYLFMTVRGVVANWRERAFYRSANPIVRTLLAPTYVSFFGFLNAQGFRQPAQGMGFAIQYALQHACDDISSPVFARYDDCHHFSHSGNFHVPDDRTVVFLDYGNQKVQQLLLEYGEKIGRDFRLSYGRERETYLTELIERRNRQTGDE